MTSWFWIPIIGIPIISVITGLFECALNSPGKVRAGGFTGILRDVTKLSLLGSGAGWITAILAEEFDPFPQLREALLAALILSLITAIFGFYLSAMADTKVDPSDDTITLTNKYWFFIHGLVYAASALVMVWILVIAVAVAIKITGS